MICVRGINCRCSRVRTNVREGGAAVALVIALVILQLVVVGMVVAGTRDQSIMGRRTEGLRSVYAADAAIGMGLRELVIDEDEDADGGIGTISNDGNAANNPGLHGAAVLATKAAGGAPTDTVITASSAAPDAARTAAITVRQTPGSAGSGGQGLAASYFRRASSASNLSQINFGATPTAIGVVHQLNFANATSSGNPMWSGGPTSNWAARFVGKLVVPTTGAWTLYLESDDGSAMRINGALVVNNDGPHGMTLRQGTVNLAAGEHDFEVQFFENGGGHGLIASWSGPGVSTRTVIPPSAFWISSAVTPPIAPVAFVGAGRLEGNNVSNEAWLDAYDSDAGAYGGGNVLTDRVVVSTNSVAAGALALASRFQLRGAAQIGTGGSPGTVVTLSGGSTISGTVAARAPAVGIPRAMLPASFSPSSLGNVTLSSARTWTGDLRYSSLTMNGSSAVITVQGDARVRVDNALTISNGGRIDLAAGATLSLWVGGALTVSGTGGGINSTGTSPSACRIYVTCTSCTMQVTEQPVIRAYIVGDRTDVILGSGSGDSPEFFGTVHARTVWMSGRTRVHGDLAGPGGELSGGAGGSGGGATYETLTWVSGP